MLAQDDNFTAEELGLELMNPYISIDISDAYGEDGQPLQGQVAAIVSVTEDLRFHSDYDKGFPDSAVFTEDGLLTEDGYRALERALESRYGATNVEYEDMLGNAPLAFFRFELSVTVPAETDLEGLSERIWEDTKLVQFHNEADPGTFGSPYLFGTVIAEYLTTLAD
jgi:hypothetical protein